jgi:exodeoxyribonuclease-3
LQEVKVEDGQFPFEPFHALGYTVASYGQRGFNGVAIASRIPMQVETRGLDSQEEMGARLLSARVGELRFTTVYCPNGKDLTHPDFERKLLWYDALAAWYGSNNSPGESHVLCGDFNVVPQPLDGWRGAAADGSIFCTAAERARFAGLMDTGLHDLYRHRHPDAQAFSWWDYRGGAFHRGQGLRIDFVLGSAPVRARVAEAAIDRDWRKKKDGLTASDHAPVVVDLD